MDKIDLISRVTGLGVITYCIGFLIYNCINLFRVFLSRVNPPDFVTKYGKWAVVTGSSDGIGLQFARELARRGMNVVLMSYVRDQLLEAAKQIEFEFKVETKAIVVDFSNHLQIYEEIARQIKDLEIGVLVNNVGVAIPYAMKVEEMSEKQIWDHISVNVLAGTKMTSLVLPGMKERGRGAIINMSGGAGLVPIPNMTVYSATKAYVDFFSRCLRAEVAENGVTIQTLTPQFINTNMTKAIPVLKGKNWTVPTAETFVKSAISTLGVLNSTTGYLPHSIQQWFILLAPNWVFNFVSEQISKSQRIHYEATVGKIKKQ